MADHESDEVYILDVDLVVQAYITFWAKLQNETDKFMQRIGKTNRTGTVCYHA